MKVNVHCETCDRILVQSLPEGFISMDIACAQCGKLTTINSGIVADSIRRDIKEAALRDNDMKHRIIRITDMDTGENLCCECYEPGVLIMLEDRSVCSTCYGKLADLPYNDVL